MARWLVARFPGGEMTGNRFSKCHYYYYYYEKTINDLVIVWYIFCYITFKCTYQICNKSANYIAIKLEIVP